MIPGKYVLLCLIYIQTMEAKGTSFCEETFIDRLFLVLEILMRGGGGHFVNGYTSQKTLGE